MPLAFVLLEQCYSHLCGFVPYLRLALTCSCRLVDRTYRRTVDETAAYWTEAVLIVCEGQLAGILTGTTISWLIYLSLGLCQAYWQIICTEHSLYQHEIDAIWNAYHLLWGPDPSNCARKLGYHICGLFTEAPAQLYQDLLVLLGSSPAVWGSLYLLWVCLWQKRGLLQLLVRVWLIAPWFLCVAIVFAHRFTLDHVPALADFYRIGKDAAWPLFLHTHLIYYGALALLLLFLYVSARIACFLIGRILRFAGRTITRISRKWRPLYSLHKLDFQRSLVRPQAPKRRIPWFIVCVAIAFVILSLTILHQLNTRRNLARLQTPQWQSPWLVELVAVSFVICLVILFYFHWPLSRLCPTCALQFWLCATLGLVYVLIGLK